MRKGTKLYGNYLDEYKVIEHIANWTYVKFLDTFLWTNC